MLGRPENSEAAPYYFTYINQVTGDNPLATMEKQLPGALEFFAGITEKSSLHRYAPDKWNIRQVLNHMTDTERAFAFRALWFARGFTASLPGYDQNIAAAGAAGGGGGRGRRRTRSGGRRTSRNSAWCGCPRFRFSAICPKRRGAAAGLRAIIPSRS